MLLAGQPAMAPIWHLARAARGPDPPSALAALRRRLGTDADAAVTAATAWLRDHLATTPGTVATVSHSSLVTGSWAGSPGRASPARYGAPDGRVANRGGPGCPQPRGWGWWGRTRSGRRGCSTPSGPGSWWGGCRRWWWRRRSSWSPGRCSGGWVGPGFEVVPLEAVAAVVVGPEVLSPAEAGRRATRLSGAGL